MYCIAASNCRSNPGHQKQFLVSIMCHNICYLYRHTSFVQIMIECRHPRSLTTHPMNTEWRTEYGLNLLPIFCYLLNTFVHKNNSLKKNFKNLYLSSSNPQLLKQVWNEVEQVCRIFFVETI